MDDSESQENEILALQNIYEERDFAVEALNPPSGRFVADVRLPSGFLVLAGPPSEQNASEKSGTSEEFFEVQYLPPITLFFEFPPNYPSHSPPAFLLSCNWLTLEELSKLAKHLESLWELTQDAVLYTWFQFLQEEALDFLKIDTHLNIALLLQFKVTDNFNSRETSVCEDVKSDSDYGEIKSSYDLIRPSTSGGSGIVDARAFNDLTLGKNLPQILRDFNLNKKKDVFKSASHTCDICFMTQEGSEFLSFRACDHAFCKSCLKSYFEVQIQDGNVKSLSCPGDKCEAQADSSMIKQIVSKELFDRYDALLLSRTLDEMIDIVYCPRPMCRAPVLLEPCGRLGSCPTCDFVFCAFCKMVYHGVAPCRFKATERNDIYQTFIQGTSEEKEQLVKKYGKKNLTQLVENAQSEEWIESFSKICPHCRTPIEKTDGCNKMTCFKCGTYFCWLCVQKLNLANPYAHFRQKGTNCYMQLFPDEIVDVNDAFFPGEFLNF